MNTIIVMYQRPVDPKAEALPSDQAMRDQLKEWGHEHTQPYEEMVELYRKKKTLMEELDKQFQNGRESNITAGRVCYDLPQRNMQWPSWLKGILRWKFNFDPVNCAFFIKHKDDDKLNGRYTWLLELKSNPAKAFLRRYPIIYFKNWLAGRVGALKETLEVEAKLLHIITVDQPSKGDDGYMDFWGAHEKDEPL